MSDAIASSANHHDSGPPGGFAPADKEKAAPADEADRHDASVPAPDPAERLRQRIEDSIGGAGAGPAV